MGFAKQLDTELNSKLGIGAVQTYRENGWTLTYQKVSSNLMSVRLQYVYVGGSSALSGVLILAGVPFNLDRNQDIPAILRVSDTVVGHGYVRFATNKGIYLSHTGYGNAVEVYVNGLLVV